MLDRLSRDVGRDSRYARKGCLTVNADDWGRNRETTDRTLECITHGTVTAVSAMVFMEDSERSAALARECQVDCGLHVNLTLKFAVPSGRAQLVEHHGRVAGFLRRHRLAQVTFHPGLARSFEYVLRAQLEEYERLYGVAPDRLDGHHHMHLAANVLLGGLLPNGTRVRRNFSFFPGEKHLLNRLYRKAVDGMLARRHRLTDYFFSLPPLSPRSRLERILSLASEATVEVETHPVNLEEHSFLMGDDLVGLVQPFRRA